ncbi:MAG: sulfotransferase [Cyanobium sp.]
MSEPQLRVLHHWACSGGTLISRCLACLPGVVFLNELHPLAHLRLLRDPLDRLYSPTDICRQLSLSHNGSDPSLVMAAFTGALSALLLKTSQQGKTLVVRSHDYIDFFVGALPLSGFSVHRAMRDCASLLSVLTLRHPLDCWLSLLQTEWYRQISQYSLDEFCRRCLLMLDAAADMPCIYYENFVADPPANLATLCRHLALEPDPQVLLDCHRIQISGDSGRRSCVIEPRPRRAVSGPLHDEISRSQHYDQLCARLGYQPDPDAPFPHLK